MKNAANFWSERVRNYGHTGWADPVVYAYDQLERLDLITQVVSKLNYPSGLALDFGCGSGDFSRMFLKLGYTVCGYDPFVKPLINSKKFLYADNLKGITFLESTADVALSVTALDHILDEEELNRSLAAVHGCLRPGGAFYMLEYALDPEDAGKFPAGSDYQSFRSLGNWMQLLQGQSFEIVSSTPVPHPHYSPSKGYTAFTRNVFVRIRRRYSAMPASRWLDPLVQWEARKLVQDMPTCLKIKSPLKLIHARTKKL
jgi:SAM-dependent methyltransferase